MTDGLVHRKNARNRVAHENVDEEKMEKNEETDDYDKKQKSKHRYLTLMEEILLLSIKDNESDSFFSDTISFSMRVCMLIELALRGRIQLEPMGARKQRLEKRNIIVVNSSITGEPLLDEALRTMSESLEADTARGWLNLLSGETWNPMELKYQMRNVRTRLAKGLVEKGACTISNINLRFFNITVNPVVDPATKKNLLNHIQNLLLKNWRTIDDLDPRDFALVAVAYGSEIIECALSNLNPKDYELAWSRVKMIDCIDPDVEAKKYAQVSSECNLNDNVRQIIYACLSAMYD